MSADERVFTRAEFFKTAIKKSLGTVWKTAESLGGPLGQLAKLGGEWQTVWTGGIPGEEPKLIFHQGRPFFLQRDHDRIRAFSGLCPHDSILVSPDSSGGFLCSFCGRDFKPLSSDHSKGLQEFAVRVEGDKILLAL